MRVTVAGHLCVDLTPALSGPARIEPGRLREVGPLRARLGGCVANTARTLARLGVPTRLRADVGTDALASLARDLAAAEGFAGDGIRAAAGASTSYSIVIEPRGVDRSFWHHPGANEQFTGEDVDTSGDDILHLGYPSLLAAMRAADGAATARLFRRASEAGTTTSLDLAVVDPASDAGATDWAAFLDRVLPWTSIVSPSIDDLRSIATASDHAWAAAPPDAVAQDLVERGAAVAMVSAGADGLHLAVAGADRLRRAGGALSRLAHWPDTRVTVAAIAPTRIVSTNGAGDAATAGLLAAILRGAHPADALTGAARAAAEAIALDPDAESDSDSDADSEERNPAR